VKNLIEPTVVTQFMSQARGWLFSPFLKKNVKWHSIWKHRDSSKRRAQDYFPLGRLGYKTDSINNFQSGQLQ